jgi:hypothetical protein
VTLILVEGEVNRNTHCCPSVQVRSNIPNGRLSAKRFEDLLDSLLEREVAESETDPAQPDVREREVALDVVGQGRPAKVPAAEAGMRHTRSGRFARRANACANSCIRIGSLFVRKYRLPTLPRSARCTSARAQS